MLFEEIMHGCTVSGKILQLLTAGKIEFPTVTEEEIKDRSK